MLRTGLPTLLALSLLAGPAVADTPQALRAGLDALASEAAQLRGVELAQAQTDPSRLAALEIRLSRIEEELRRMTGRLESLEYGRDRAQDRLDKLVADLDARLTRIEGGAPAPSAELPVEEAAPRREPPPFVEPPAETAATAPLRPGGRAAPSPQDDAAAQRGYVLGTLPREAIMGGGSGAGATPRAAAPEPQRQAALPRPDTPRGRYDAALALLQDGDFGSAQDEFRDFLADYADDPLAPSAAYWLGETHYVQRDFANAAAQFAKNFQTYGDSAQKAPDNLLKMGMSLSQLGQRQEACRVFDELASRFPNAAPPIKQAAARGRAGAGCG
jgi:tol-pal system protein YbgF